MTWNETHGWRHRHASRSYSSCWSITMQHAPLRDPGTRLLDAAAVCAAARCHSDMTPNRHGLRREPQAQR